VVTPVKSSASEPVPIKEFVGQNLPISIRHFPFWFEWQMENGKWKTANRLSAVTRSNCRPITEPEN
jgi:hypothetical protein